MSYPRISDSAKMQLDKYGAHNAIEVGAILQNLSHNVVSNVIEAGATGATVNLVAFVAPEKMKITSVKFIMATVQTGTDNTPTVGLYNLTDTDVVAVSGAIALSGTIGDVTECVIDSDYEDVEAGDVLMVQVINPTATITIAIQGVLVIEYNSIA